MYDILMILVDFCGNFSIILADFFLPGSRSGWRKELYYKTITIIADSIAYDYTYDYVRVYIQKIYNKTWTKFEEKKSN